MSPPCIARQGPQAVLEDLDRGGSEEGLLRDEPEHGGDHRAGHVVRSHVRPHHARQQAVAQQAAAEETRV
ncbi:hypothetical protein GCM10010104_43430 [Streptomyces indiaensis]|uniref:Uncharacterized protein n=1 Tax=Streptomyces indiaensis TaxID=284033 RepID=A0ABN3DWD3_9ACTN